MPDSTIRKPLPEMGQVYEPYGWPAAAHENQARQALQVAEGQRRRADQLARRCRRLRAVTASALAISIVGMVCAFGLGAIVGFSFGSGLLGVLR